MKPRWNCVSGACVINLANSFYSQTQKIANAFPDEATRPTKGGGVESSEYFDVGQ
ncbi:hypothetical protein BJ956_002587 [Arthrobacter psychrochitiniphilus]|nr:hypothetical protein [Arthrobacter psychrochitiniphilus]